LEVSDRYCWELWGAVSWCAAWFGKEVLVRWRSVRLGEVSWSGLVFGKDRDVRFAMVLPGVVRPSEKREFLRFGSCGAELSGPVR